MGERRYPVDTVSALTYRFGLGDVAGSVHGGWMLKLCDDVAANAATAGPAGAGTVADMKFRSPVPAGGLVTLRAPVNAARHMAMEVGVRVESENVRTGDIGHVSTAPVTVVALDDEHTTAGPTRVPVTPEDDRRHGETNLRREVRLPHARRAEAHRAGRGAGVARRANDPLQVSGWAR